ncbi:hypothetical protein M9991_15080 [Chryseobacterium gallinarum]|uniref:hypothetical protein n=1 Tax=Chryseobacterium gallinarum TaxID=1324352 RepID=UPI002023D260|nr:hypothetical protein [Chryseobacterium gallinarum]MCL8538192.1 hypothetical protein [Chryseobacterium gallinarum]
MKTRKTLKFSKETVILLDKTAKKSINGGAKQLNAGASSPPVCATGRWSDCWC